MVTHYDRPATLADAVARLAAAGDDGKLVAGGTALVLMLNQGLISPSRLISLDAIVDGGYRGIGSDGPTIRIGGGETVADIAANALVRDRLPSLAYACRRVGNARIRNRATLAGNLAEADYGSDPPTVLVSLGAYCRTASPRGGRSIPVRDLITGFYSTALEPDEVLVEVDVPVPPATARMSYVKYVSRAADDRPCVGVAAVARIELGVFTDLTVVVGAAAEKPQMFPDLLIGARSRPADQETCADIAARYAERIRPLDDGRGSAAYRTRMIDVFVRRALRLLLKQAP